MGFQPTRLYFLLVPFFKDFSNTTLNIFMRKFKSIDFHRLIYIYIYIYIYNIYGGGGGGGVLVLIPGQHWYLDYLPACKKKKREKTESNGARSLRRLFS